MWFLVVLIYLNFSKNGKHAIKLSLNYASLNQKYDTLK